MIDLLIENKEWLFSGIGVTILTVIGSRTFKAKPPVIENTIILKTEKIKEKDDKSENEANSEVSQISIRFKKVLDLMNEGREHSQYSIAQLAQVMKLHKVSELENVFRGKEEPTFQFIDNFSEYFGVNRDWLIDGKYSPFFNDEQTMGEPLWYLDQIETIKPQRIFFIRENSDTAPVFLLLKIDDFKFKILRRTWHVSDKVGAGGSRQLVSFYQLIIALRDKHNYAMKCGGLTLESTNFNNLLSGEVYPGMFTDIRFREDPWWDDFTDINHKYPIAENYELWHGKSFIKAQIIVSNMLNERIS